MFMGIVAFSFAAPGAVEYDLRQILYIVFTSLPFIANRSENL